MYREFSTTLKAHVLLTYYLNSFHSCETIKWVMLLSRKKKNFMYSILVNECRWNVICTQSVCWGDFSASQIIFWTECLDAFWGCLLKADRISFGVVDVIVSKGYINHGSWVGNDIEEEMNTFDGKCSRNYIWASCDQRL